MDNTDILRTNIITLSNYDGMGENLICGSSKKTEDICNKISSESQTDTSQTDTSQDTILYNTKNESIALTDIHKITYIPNIKKIITYAKERQLKLIHNNEKIIDRKKNPQKYNFIEINEDDCSFICSKLESFNFIVFCAVSTSSIIKKLSIIGSDIDVGKIITEKRVPDEIQLEIINYLKKKGFNIYHHSESLSKAESEGIMFFTLDDMKYIFNSIYDTLKYHTTTNNNDMIMAFSNHNLMKFFASEAICGDMCVKFNL